MFDEGDGPYGKRVKTYNLWLRKFEVEVSEGPGGWSLVWTEETLYEMSIDQEKEREEYRTLTSEEVEVVTQGSQPVHPLRTTYDQPTYLLKLVLSYRVNKKRFTSLLRESSYLYRGS